MAELRAEESQVDPGLMPEQGLNEAEKQYPLPPSRLDVEVYRDPARYRRELEGIFFRTWFPACPSSDVAKPRDYIVWDQLEQSVVIARQDDQALAAWHNVCQHRGARLLEGSGSCASGRVTCPWHGFGYDLDGRVTGVPLREAFDAAELKDLRAPAVRVEEWAGWVWLTFSGETPPLLDYLGDIGNELTGYGLHDFKVVFRHSVRLHANWKIVVDAFNETWHVPWTHKDSLSGIVMWREAVLRITAPHSWMTIPIQGFTDKVTSDDHHKSHLCHYLAFPNTIFSCFPTHLQMWSTWPVAPDETIITAYQIAGPTPDGMTDEKWAARNERDWKSFLEVLDEDSEVINHFADIVKSRGYTRNLFNTAESRITAFHQEVSTRLQQDRNGSRKQ